MEKWDLLVQQEREEIVVFLVKGGLVDMMVDLVVVVQKVSQEKMVQREFKVERVSLVCVAQGELRVLLVNVDRLDKMVPKVKEEILGNKGKKVLLVMRDNEDFLVSQVLRVEMVLKGKREMLGHKVV